MTSYGPDWFADAYHLSPFPESLLTLADAEQTLGGVAGEAVAETTDEDPARVAFVADAISAYFRAALTPDHAEWTALGEAPEGGDGTWSLNGQVGPARPWWMPGREPRARRRVPARDPEEGGGGRSRPPGGGGPRGWRPRAPAVDNDPAQAEASRRTGEDDMRGAILGGRYQLREPIGAGGMGTVWRATDQLLRRDVAVKTLLDFTGPEASELARRFHREIRVSSLLRDPHIVEAHDSGEARVDGRPVLYLVMEEVPGEPLNRLLAARSPSLAEIGRWADGICAALTSMHRAGIVHRDLKPANVMIGPDGHATVLDFGIARVEADGLDLSTLTRSGHLVGTFAYMSPEQALGASALDGRSDLYSLGCLLYAALVGRPPFADGPWHVVLRRHVDEAPVPPGALRAGLPPAWEALVLDLLAKAPEDRPANAPAVRERLAALPVPREAAPLRGQPGPPPPTPIDPDASTRDAPAAVARGGHPEDSAAPTDRTAARTTPGPPAPPNPTVAPGGTHVLTGPPPGSLPAGPPGPSGDEVIARGVTTRQLSILVVVVLLLLGGLVTLVLVASGREAGPALGTSGLILGGGLLAALVLGILYDRYTGRPPREERRTAARIRRAAAEAEAAAREEEDAARGVGSPAHVEALAAVDAAITAGRTLWVAYRFRGALRWVHLQPLRFDHGQLVALTASSQEPYYVADFRLRGTSESRPPGV
ncbi:serine/threonine-protein kinase [Streptomyces sp. NPDC048606]|uniref:serine/threonine-protein kinase n=1 Tax=Streptomyces sp. NPDC048606 TaxID=3154726 RepID=UPI0034369992